MQQFLFVQNFLLHIWALSTSIHNFLATFPIVTTGIEEDFFRLFLLPFFKNWNLFIGFLCRNKILNIGKFLVDPVTFMSLFQFFVLCFFAVIPPFLLKKYDIKSVKIFDNYGIMYFYSWRRFCCKYTWRKLFHIYMTIVWDGICWFWVTDLFSISENLPEVCNCFLSIPGILSF